MYDKGRGVRQDFRAAAFWYQKAAAQGYTAAQFSLGSMYDVGEGVPLDVRKASQLFEASARQGNSRAQFAIGIQYEVGRGVARDRARALYWFNQSARGGDDAADCYVRALAVPGAPQFANESALTAHVQNTHCGAPAPAPSAGPREDCGYPPTSVFQCNGLTSRCLLQWAATCMSLERQSR